MENSNTNNFWSRPEGKTAKVILSILGIATAGVAYLKLLPFLLTMVWGTIQLGIGAGIILAAWFLFNSERVHSLCFLALSAVSRAITSLFVNIDPVGILKDFVKNMEKKRESVQDAIKSMRGVRQKSRDQLALKTREMNEALKLADVAEQSGNEEKVAEMTEKVGRRQKAIDGLSANIAFADETIAALERVDRVIEFHINNSKDEMNELSTGNELALQMLAATHAASEALGDTDMRDVRNMAADVIRDRVAKATGEVENLLATTRSVQSEMDLTQLSLRADGRAKLNQLRSEVSKAEIGKGPTVRSIGSGAAQPVANKWANVVNVRKQ